MHILDSSVFSSMNFMVSYLISRFLIHFEFFCMRWNMDLVSFSFWEGVSHTYWCSGLNPVSAWGNCLWCGESNLCNCASQVPYLVYYLLGPIFLLLCFSVFCIVKNFDPSGFDPYIPYGPLSTARINPWASTPCYIYEVMWSLSCIICIPYDSSLHAYSILYVEWFLCMYIVKANKIIFLP